MKNLPKALVRVHFIRWIATYPLDEVTHSLDNRGLVFVPNSVKNYFRIIEVQASVVPDFMFIQAGLFESRLTLIYD